jgi:hypothetical protein
MKPDLEFFLEQTFDPVEPTSPEIGRVIVEPDYETSYDAAEATSLRKQLIACLAAQSPKAKDLSAPGGYEVHSMNKYPVLAKYIRRITLHKDTVEGPWIEVAPPGNWI